MFIVQFFKASLQKKIITLSLIAQAPGTFEKKQKAIKISKIPILFLTNIKCINKYIYLLKSPLQTVISRKLWNRKSQVSSQAQDMTLNTKLLKSICFVTASNALQCCLNVILLFYSFRIITVCSFQICIYCIA